MTCGHVRKEPGVVAREWPACLRAVTAVALLPPEALQLTMGADSTIFASHNLTCLLESRRTLTDR